MLVFGLLVVPRITPDTFLVLRPLTNFVPDLFNLGRTIIVSLISPDMFKSSDISPLLVSVSVFSVQVTTFLNYGTLVELPGTFCTKTVYPSTKLTMKLLKMYEKMIIDVKIGQF